jgi:hypothetical protein
MNNITQMSKVVEKKRAFEAISLLLPNFWIKNYDKNKGNVHIGKNTIFEYLKAWVDG